MEIIPTPPGLRGRGGIPVAGLRSALFALLLASAPRAIAKPVQLAVLPLSAQGIAPADAVILTDALSNALMRQGAVRIMERQQIDKILGEQGFQNSGACDGSECAVEVGQMLGIDQVVIGSVGKLGSSYVVNSRLVDVRTGEIVASSSRSQRGDIDDLLQSAVPLVAGDLSGAPTTVPHPVAAVRRDTAKPVRPPTTLAPGEVVVRGLDAGEATLEFGPVSGLKDGDVYGFADSTSGESGWLSVVSRPDSAPAGGLGVARCVSGRPAAGQHLLGEGLWPVAFEVAIGSASGYDRIAHEPILVRAQHGLAETEQIFLLRGWWRTPMFWLGVSAGLENLLGYYYELDYSVPTNSDLFFYGTSERATTYFLGVGLRKDLPLYGRLGALFQIDGRFYAAGMGLDRGSTKAANTYGLRLGPTCALGPGLSVALEVGTEGRGDHNPIDAGQLSYGFSLTWIPSSRESVRNPPGTPPRAPVPLRARSSPGG